VGALQGRLGIDEDRRRQEQLDLGPPAEMPGTQAVPQPGQLHAERVSRLCGGVLSPAGHQQLIAGHWTATAEDEVGEQDPPYAAGQRVLDAGAINVGDEATAQLDSGLRPLAHQTTSGQQSLSPFVTASIRKGRGRRGNSPARRRLYERNGCDTALDHRRRLMCEVEDPTFCRTPADAIAARRDQHRRAIQIDTDKLTAFGPSHSRHQTATQGDNHDRDL